MSHWNHHAFTAQSETIPNCPVHPVTNDLPSPLPQKILDALDSVENQLSAIVNSTSLVHVYSSSLNCHWAGESVNFYTVCMYSRE